MRRISSFLAAALLVTGVVVSAAPGVASAHRGHSHKAAAKAARFVATGTLVAVDLTTASDTSLGTLVIAVEGGNRKDLRGSTASFVVAATATIEKDGLPATIDQLVAGDHVMVKGLRQTDGTWRAGKVRASSPEPVLTDPVF